MPFLAAYNVAHRCKCPGCGMVLVIDGNQKNRRDVCGATHAGVIQYEGLPGSIQSGCQLSPQYRSKYCFYHSPRVSRSSNLPSDNKSESEGVVRFIIGKRSTQSGVSYQVHNVKTMYACTCTSIYGAE